MAINRANLVPNAIFHSDRGVQYASDDFKKVLQSNGIKQSMSARGNCYDNAPMESFFHSLKVEFTHHREHKFKVLHWNF